MADTHGNIKLGVDITANTKSVDSELKNLTKSVTDTVDAINKGLGSAPDLFSKFANAAKNTADTVSNAAKKTRAEWIDIFSQKYFKLKSGSVTGEEIAKDFSTAVKDVLHNQGAQAAEEFVRSFDVDAALMAEKIPISDTVKSEVEKSLTYLQELHAQLKELKSAKREFESGGGELTTDQQYGELLQTIENVKSEIDQVTQTVRTGAVDGDWAISDANLVKLINDVQEYSDKLKELRALGMHAGFAEFDAVQTSLDSAKQALTDYQRQLEEQKQPQIDKTVADQTLVDLIERVHELEEEMQKLNGAGLTMGYEAYDETSSALDEAKSALAEYLEYLEYRSQPAAEIFMNGIYAGADALRDFNRTLFSIEKQLVRVIGRLGKMASHGRKSGQSLEKSFKKALMMFLRIGLGVRGTFALFRKLRTVAVNAINEIAKQSSDFNARMSETTTLLNGLKGSVGTMVQPLVQAVLPVLNSIIQALTEAFIMAGKFFAVLSGQGFIYKATANQKDYAKSLKGTGSAAKDANAQLMKFDEINKLQDSSGGGGGADDAGYTYDVENLNPEDAVSKFASMIRDAWSDGDFGDVGAYLSEWLRKELVKFENWVQTTGASILNKIASSLATFISGVVANKDLANQIGSTIASVINTAVHAINDFLTKTPWAEVGNFIVTGLNSLVDSIHADELGQLLGNQISAIVNVAYSVISGFHFDELGQKLAEFINNAIQTMSVPDEDGKTIWTKIGETLSRTVGGLLEFLTNALNDTNWDEFGNGLGEMFAGIEWGNLAVAAFNFVKALFKAIGDTLNGWAETDEISATIATILLAIPAITTALPVLIPIVSGFVNILSIAFSALSTVFSLIGSFLGMLGSGIATVAGFISSTLIPAIGSILTAFAPVIKFIAWNLAGVITFFGGLVLAIKGFVSAWQDGVSVVSTLMTVLGAAIAAVGAIILGIPALPALVVAAITAAVLTIVALIKNNWQTVKGILDLVVETFKLIGTIIMGVITTLVSSVTGAFLGLFAGVITAGKGWINDIVLLIQGIVHFITGVFTGDWQKAWTGVAEIVTGVWDSIANAIRLVVNTIIGFINGMIKGAVSGINVMIRNLNTLQWTIPDYIPVIGGKHFGFNIAEVTAPQIPYLAQGAVIPPNNEFLAMLGDQKSGTNIEAPLDTIKQALAEVIRDMDGNQTIQVTLMLDGKELARNQVAHINNLSRLAGRSVIV